MKLIGNLKKQVEETSSKDEARSLIEKAGMALTDDELDQVAGGQRFSSGNCQLTGGLQNNITGEQGEQP